MRVLKIWDSEYPWDVRAEKICRTLTASGHHVDMVARNRSRAPVQETLEECTVHRLAPWWWAGRRFDHASQFPAFFNPRWLGLILRTARRHASELILVRDITLAPPAIWAARRLGVPVILDMAENYPAMIADLWATGATRFGDGLVRNPRAVAAVERWVLDRVDHVLVMVEESRDRLVSLGVPEASISIVSNTPSVERVDEYARLRDSTARSEDSSRDALSLVYLGFMEEARGVGVAIEAVALARRAGIPATLDLIGEGRAVPSFRKRAAALGLSDDIVRFRGFLPYRQALAEVSRHDAGLIPHYSTESWETTIPNKLFDYMSLGLPVIASDVRPVKRILEEARAGLVFRDRDPADLARVFGTLYHSAEGRADLGAAGIRAIRSRYNWETDARRLHSAIEGVMLGQQAAGKSSSGDGARQPATSPMADR